MFGGLQKTQGLHWMNPLCNLLWEETGHRAERGGVAYGKAPRWSRAWRWDRCCKEEQGQLGSVSPAIGQHGCVSQARVIGGEMLWTSCVSACWGTA